MLVDDGAEAVETHRPRSEASVEAELSLKIDRQKWDEEGAGAVDKRAEAEQMGRAGQLEIGLEQSQASTPALRGTSPRAVDERAGFYGREEFEARRGGDGPIPRPESREDGAYIPYSSHSSGIWLSFSSALVPLAISHSSGTPL